MFGGRSSLVAASTLGAWTVKQPMLGYAAWNSGRIVDLEALGMNVALGMMIYREVFPELFPKNPE